MRGSRKKEGRVWGEGGVHRLAGLNQKKLSRRRKDDSLGKLKKNPEKTKKKKGGGGKREGVGGGKKHVSGVKSLWLEKKREKTGRLPEVSSESSPWMRG